MEYYLPRPKQLLITLEEIQRVPSVSSDIFTPKTEQERVRSLLMHQLAHRDYRRVLELAKDFKIGVPPYYLREAITFYATLPTSASSLDHMAWAYQQLNEHSRLADLWSAAAAVRIREFDGSCKKHMKYLARLGQHTT